MKKIFQLFLVSIIALNVLSCADSIDPTACDTEQYALALNNWMEVRATYIDNPTTENCNNLRFALQAYINSGENCEQFSDFVEARQNELDNLNCN